MDKATYVQAIDAYAERLFRVAWAILGNQEDVADALQETALQAWKHREQLREEAYMGTWLTRICINVSRSIRRKRRPGIAMEAVPETSVQPPDPSLSMALQALPESLRLPLVLHYAEGMSYEETAQALRLPVSTVRGRIARAKERLRKELEA